MKLPVRRDALRERDRLDGLDEQRAASDESASARIELTIELSDLVRAIGEGARASWISAPSADLAEKARFYCRILTVAKR